VLDAGLHLSDNFVTRSLANGVMRFVVQRPVFTFTLAVAAALTLGLFQPAAVRAAEVSLTSGSVVMNCPGPGAGNARIDLAGPDFSLIFSYLARPDPNCAGAEQPLQPARFDAFSVATFQGTSTFEMTGFLSFNETSLTGFVEGRDLFTRQSLFTVNFTGAGIGSISTTRSTFQVVPEPTTLALLGIGAALFSGTQRLRNRRKAKV
jgi:hypothetical protein